MIFLQIFSDGPEKSYHNMVHTKYGCTIFCMFFHWRILSIKYHLRCFFISGDDENGRYVGEPIVPRFLVHWCTPCNACTSECSLCTEKGYFFAIGHIVLTVDGGNLEILFLICENVLNEKLETNYILSYSDIQ